MRRPLRVVLIGLAGLALVGAGVGALLGQRHDDARDAVRDALEVPATWTLDHESVRDSGILIGCSMFVIESQVCASALEVYALPEVPSDLTTLTDLLPDATWTSDSTACLTEAPNTEGTLTTCAARTTVDGFSVEVRIRADALADGSLTDPFASIRIQPS